MSLKLETLDGRNIECGFYGPWIAHVMMGSYKIPLKEFCSFAKGILKEKPDVVHLSETDQVSYEQFYSLVDSIITGGIYGWAGRDEIPLCVFEFAKEYSEFMDILLEKADENERLNALHNPITTCHN